MNIDWFTFAAQIINFLVLVALLRWLLYGPIVRAMEKREEKIADRLEEADRKRKEAEQSKNEYQQKSDQLNEEREQLINEAKQKADERQKQLIREAKESVEAKRQEWNDALQRERDDLLAEIRREAAHVGLRAARQTLAQLADAELEQQMCDAFAERIEQLDDERRQDIAERLNNGDTKVVVSSQFELPDDHKDRLRRAIHEKFTFDGDIAFDKSRDLMCGLELEVGGYSFGWNVNEFLGDMQRRLDDKLKV